MSLPHVFAVMGGDAYFHLLPGEYVDAKVAEQLLAENTTLKERIAGLEKTNQYIASQRDEYWRTIDKRNLRINELWRDNDILGKELTAARTERDQAKKKLAEAKEAIVKRHFFAGDEEVALFNGETQTSYLYVRSDLHECVRRGVDIAIQQRDAALDAEKKALAAVDKLSADVKARDAEIEELRVHPVAYGYNRPKSTKIIDANGQVRGFTSPAGVIIEP